MIHQSEHFEDLIVLQLMQRSFEHFTDAEIRKDKVTLKREDK